MAQIPDLGPLTMTQDGNRVHFTFSPPDRMTLELPPNYEQFLIQALDAALGAGSGLELILDLQERPAISSRQLGLMLALRKALRRYVDPLPLTGVSAGVRRLLVTTRTARFFKLTGESPNSNG